jgi:predicted dehydrogenase
LVAVASRSTERAAMFAENYGVPTTYSDYESLASDPVVEVVYVATPQSRHEADTIALLEAGKHVLCEKPFALNARQARRMVEVARAHGRFLMEGLWSRLLPAYRELVAIIGAGRIGEPLFVEADFGYRIPPGRPHRLLQPDLGGGGLLDLGIYPLQLCSLVLGPPENVVADGRMGESGVDEVVVAVLRYPGKRLAVIKSAISVNMSCRGLISGSDGSIEIPAMMHCPNALTIRTAAGEEHIDASYDGNGLRFEIAEVNRCLREGLTESPAVPLGETIQLASTLDIIRSQIGLVFPGE